MARLDGKGTVPASPSCTQLRSRSRAACPDTSFRTSILFCNLPSRSNAGHHFMDTWKDKEEEQIPLQLLPCQELAQIRSAGNLHNRTYRRHPLSGCPCSPIQRIRTHRIQPHGTIVPMGKQLLRMDCGEGGQLCILQH